MKKITFLFLVISFGSFAQEKTDKKKQEEDPLKKVEAEFNKAFDGLFKTKKKESTDTKSTQDKPKTQAKESDSESFGGFSFGGKPKASYDFVASMTMKMTQKNPKDKQSFTMRNKYMFAEDMSAMAIKFIGSDNPDMAKASSDMDAMIMDFEQKKMFTFLTNEGKKTLMAIGLKTDATEKYVEEENQKIKITKTSQTKTIAGYKCDGYLLENGKDKENMLMWISQNNVGEMAKLARKMSTGFSSMNGKSNSKNYMAYNAHPEFVKIAEQGRMVLGFSVKGENGEETEMEFEDIKPNDKFLFATSAYKSMF